MDISSTDRKRIKLKSRRKLSNSLRKDTKGLIKIMSSWVNSLAWRMDKLNHLRRWSNSSSKMTAINNSVLLTSRRRIASSNYKESYRMLNSETSVRFSVSWRRWVRIKHARSRNNWSLRWEIVNFRYCWTTSVWSWEFETRNK